MHFIIVTLMVEYTLFIYIASVYMLQSNIKLLRPWNILYMAVKMTFFSGKCALFSYVSLIYLRDCGVLDTWAF